MEARSRPGVDFSEDSVDKDIWDLKKEGKDEDAILAAEESLHRVVVSYGPTSEETRRVATDLVLAYNHLSMKRLAENNIKVNLPGLTWSACLVHGLSVLWRIKKTGSRL